MKCLILAGGSGDSLWPLSRKNYPKQFMNIKEGRSLLQETIVRNMPFCDEFIIITNESYINIVVGQMKAFQGLRYRIILEGLPKGTAPAIALGCLFCNQSELVFVVSSDNLVEGNGYKTAILEAKELAKNEGALVTFGAKPTNVHTSYSFIQHTGEHINQFVEKATIEQSQKFSYENGYLWNTGMFVFRAGDFLNALRNSHYEMFKACRAAKHKVPAIRSIIHFPDFIIQDIPSGSVEGTIFEKTDIAKVIEIDFQWQDIGNVNDMQGIGAEFESNPLVIQNKCEDVEVINRAQKQLVVTNDVKDVVVVNTEDAVYVSRKESVEDIKDIIKEHHEGYDDYFDYNRLSYREWGIHELLTAANGYKVKKVTVFPGMSMNLHQHEFRSEHWSVVEGIATITLGEEEKEYQRFESVFVPVGMKHKVANHTDENVVIIEVGIGEKLTDNDTVRIYGHENNVSNAYVADIVKLDPAFKDNLWGGTKLRTVFGKKCDYDIIAESWELSAHPDGQSRIAEGRFRGMLFNEYLKRIGKEAQGWKCQALDRFPILIKFIDAMKPLSVQIHPDDEYALEVEGEYGKNEVWYVVDCEEGASLYCGLAKEATKEEIRQRIADNTITEILNEVKVKKGDVVFIKAGTIHAIGAGILICEIQQNSNSTYRLYDYDRRDKYGNPRELHVEKALDVVNLEPYEMAQDVVETVVSNENMELTRIVQCKYFECFKCEVHDEGKIAVDETSFVSVVFITGEGTITVADRTLNFKPGDSFFVTAGKKSIVIQGKCECIVTHV